MLLSSIWQAGNINHRKIVAVKNEKIVDWFALKFEVHFRFMEIFVLDFSLPHFISLQLNLDVDFECALNSMPCAKASTWTKINLR